MTENISAVRAMICANKGFEDKLILYEYALGKEKQTCSLYHHMCNAGNAHVYCGKDYTPPYIWPVEEPECRQA
jgi:hypothetical protein